MRNDPDLIKASLLREARELCNSGVLTPDHVTRTKNLWAYVEDIPEEDPILQQRVKEAVNSYQAAYDQYFETQVKAKKIEREKLDSYPRVFLVAGAGIVALGFTRKAARIAADIAEHTLRAKLQANALGVYAPIANPTYLIWSTGPCSKRKLGRSSFSSLRRAGGCCDGAERRNWPGCC